MKDTSKILRKPPYYDYEEKVPSINSSEFQKVIDSRRSVRVFDNTAIPENIVDRVLQNALLAPNSSNLQPWEFYRVKTSDKKIEMIKACLNQSAAKTAAELFVVVARTDTWKGHAREMVSLFKSNSKVTPEAIMYYEKLAPIVYTQGIFGIFGFIKRILYFFTGLKRPILREPVSKKDLKLWAVKTAALGAENLMLSLSASGFDSCPMEGMDSKRVKKILGLKRNSFIVMVIAAGKRAPGGVYGPRIRFDSERYIKTV